MISRFIDKVCDGDVSLVENYDTAMRDETNMWDYHIVRRKYNGIV